MTANPSQNMPTQPPRAFLLRAVFHFGASIDVCFVSHLCHRRYSGVADFVRPAPTTTLPQSARLEFIKRVGLG